MATRQKMKMTIADRILAIVHSDGLGKRVYTPKDFNGFGSTNAVYKALSRLTGNGSLQRIGKGLYFWPAVSKVLNRSVPPAPDAVVAAIAKRDGVDIVPDDIFAANDLGFTDAVPAKPVYRTSGHRRMTITVGGQTIVLKPMTNPQRAATDRGAIKVIQALTFIREDGARRADAIGKLRQSLMALSDKALLSLRRAADKLPAWMGSLVRTLAASPS